MRESHFIRRLPYKENVEIKKIKQPEPLNDKEIEALQAISKRIQKATQENDIKTASFLRQRLIAAAGIVITKEEAIDAALPPMSRKKQK